MLAPLPAGGIVGVLASPDGRTLYVEAGKQAVPHLVDVSVPLKLRKPLPLPPLREGWTFNAADWSHDGRWLVGFARYDGTLARSIIYLFDMERRSYRTLAELEGGEYDCAWLPDSRRLLVWHYAGEDGELRIVDRESGAMTSAGSIGRGFANLRFARDGRALYGNTWLRESDIWMLDYEVKGEGSKATN
jgi:hypothetical protein